MELRKYQFDLKTAIYYQWELDVHANVMAVLPTGGGKTVLFAKILAEHVGAAVAIAHRQELVEQISLALAREGIRHRLIAPKHVIKRIVSLHMAELGSSFYQPGALVAVAGVDTLKSRSAELNGWLEQVTLVVQDEGHHVLTCNKWGKAFSMFPNARALLVTATPCRADGKGLGREHDGIVDVMVEGPDMRWLIDNNHLTDYRIFCPPSNLDLGEVTLAKDGDYNKIKLSAAVKQSSIMGDVVEHYLRIAPGKLGITFAPSVEIACEMAAKFTAASVPTEVVSGKTGSHERADILRRFRNREVLMLVNVDLFGEGFDLPAMEVVIFARPTQSFALYCLDPDTEILTPDGWVSHGNINDIKQVIAYDKSDGSTHVTPVISTIKRELYDSESMYGIQGPHLDIFVSDKHNMIVKGASSTCVNWQTQKAEKLAARKAMCRIPVAGNGKFKGTGLMDAEISLLGWYLSDGTINRKTNGLSIAQAANKTKHRDHIRSTLEKSGLKFGEYVYKRKNVPDTHNDICQFIISKGEPRGRDKHLSGWAHLEKWLHKDIPNCYDNMTRGEFKILLESLNLGDGVNNHGSLDYVKRTLTITCGDNKQMADRLQAMCVTRGFRCNIATPHYEGYSKWYILHIRDCMTSTMPGTSDKDGTISGKKEYKRSRFQKIEYKPKFVWCVENDLGTLIIRRNGKVSIVGNCQQFGRVLRKMEGKEVAIVIDHVGNVIRHGLPDAAREWSLARRDKRAKTAYNDEIPLRVCLNDNCLQPYEATLKCCPYCGFVPVPQERATPQQVDGDLCELSPEALAEMRGAIDRVDGAARVPQHLEPYMQQGVRNHHHARQQTQQELRDVIAYWAGMQPGDVSEIQKRFFFTFGVDTMTPLAYGKADANKLRQRVQHHIGDHIL